MCTLTPVAGSSHFRAQPCLGTMSLPLHAWFRQFLLQRMEVLFPRIIQLRLDFPLTLEVHRQSLKGKIILLTSLLWKIHLGQYEEGLTQWQESHLQSSKRAGHLAWPGPSSCLWNSDHLMTKEKRERVMVSHTSSLMIINDTKINYTRDHGNVEISFSNMMLFLSDTGGLFSLHCHWVCI